MRPGFLGALVVHLYGELLWYVTSTVEKKRQVRGKYTTAELRVPS
jgi:hypothetical protein